MKEAIAEPNARIELTGGFPCSLSEAAHLEGTGNVTVVGGTANPTLRLI